MQPPSKADTLLSRLRTKSNKDLAAASSISSSAIGGIEALVSPSGENYPADPDAYELLEDCGRGVSATVHRARCTTNGEVVAVKRMNLEHVSMTLDEIVHEAATMRAYHHPNVLPLLTSFVSGTELWMVTPFMAGGSALHIMKYRFPGGLDEPVIATVARFVLLALAYVHAHGGIHRDVKAGNVLVDGDGSVKLGDFGVAATVERGGSWGADRVARTTFVGTPCWMAPEVMEQSAGYDSSADIWSFGITLLELANGHAPFARFPPMKVLLLTLQNPPPQLDDADASGRRHFSRHMRTLVARCLQKDPRARPSAVELLNDRFFKQARDEEFLVRALLLRDLPPLAERVQRIRAGAAATTAAENDRRLERSQEEYAKGVSSWNFDLAALKAAAAAEPDGADDAAGGSSSGRLLSSAAPVGASLPSIAEDGAVDGTSSRGAGCAWPEDAIARPSKDSTAVGMPPPAAASSDGGRDGDGASAIGQRGRFRIIAEDPPLQPQPQPTDQASATELSHGLCVRRFGETALMPELARLHEQAVAHAAVLAQLLQAAECASAQTRRVLERQLPASTSSEAGADDVGGNDSMGGAHVGQRGRFRIIAEDPSPQPPLQPTDQASATELPHGLCVSSFGETALMLELARLHEQAVAHAAALAQLLEAGRQVD